MSRMYLSRMAIAVALAALLLGACGEQAGPGTEIHGTGYQWLGPDGKALDGGSGPCVQDRHTGLVWEVKSDASGLHDWRNTYSWYDPDEDHGSEAVDYRGTPGAGQCADSGCDTFAYVEAVNREGYCGFSDWRVPLRDELASISDPGKTGQPPTANLDYFPYMRPAEYWSSNDYHFQYDSAWAWNFLYGHDRVDWKKTPKYVRLVRGEAADLRRVKD